MSLTVEHYTAEVPRESGMRAREMIDAAQGDPNGRYACVEVTTDPAEHDQMVCPKTGYDFHLCVLEDHDLVDHMTREGT